MKKLKFLYKLTIFFMITFTVIITCLYTYAYFSPKITLNSANALSLYDNENNLILQTSNNKKWANINEISNNLEDIDVIVFGHSHKYFYEVIDNTTYLNPGSCGKRRFSLPINFAIMTIENDNYKIEKIEILNN